MSLAVKDLIEATVSHMYGVMYTDPKGQRQAVDDIKTKPEAFKVAHELKAKGNTHIIVDQYADDGYGNYTELDAYWSV